MLISCNAALSRLYCFDTLENVIIWFYLAYMNYLTPLNLYCFTSAIIPHALITLGFNVLITFKIPAQNLSNPHLKLAAHSMFLLWCGDL